MDIELKGRMGFNVFDSGLKGERHMNKWLEEWSITDDRQGAQKNVSKRSINIMPPFFRGIACILK
jgi:hypothetical protein